MNEEKNKIEKPWAVYKGVMGFPKNIGVVVREAPKGRLYLIYSDGEGQESPEEHWWDQNYVTRFDTPIEAVSYLVERSEGRSLKKELERLSGNFSKLMKKEKLEELCHLLVQHRNFLLAQSSPKCIESNIPPFLGDDFGEFLYPTG